MSPLPLEIVGNALSSAGDLDTDLSMFLAVQASADDRRERQRFVGYLVEWLEDPSVGPLAMRSDTYAELTSATLQVVSRWTDVMRAAAWELVLAALDDQRRCERSTVSATA